MCSGDNFPELKNDLIIKAALGEHVDRVPVWIMRQAGRYLPEFRKLREKYDFFTICQTPELSCEITLQPINRFNLDAAIIFSDILVIPQAVGQEVEMRSGVGPVMPKPISNKEDLDKLNWNVNVKEELKYVYDAITLTRHKLDGKVPLIGFAGAPWTIMSYMIEGGGSKTMSKSKKWLYLSKEDSHEFLKRLTKVTQEYLLEQVRGGAQMLQVFESHAGILGPDQFNEFSLPYLRQISEYLKSEIAKLNLSYKVPLIVFAKDAHYALKELSISNYDVVSLDWTVDPRMARSTMCPNITLQGNLDPPALYCSNAELIEQTRIMMEKFGTQRYIANLGHGIYPDMDPDHVKLFVDSVHDISQKMISDKNLE